MDTKTKIATLVDGFNRSLDYLREKNPSMTEDNYDEIKKLMTEVMAEWLDSSDQEIDDHINELLVESFGILWCLEALYMIQQHRREARS